MNARDVWRSPKWILMHENVEKRKGNENVKDINTKQSTAYGKWR